MKPCRKKKKGSDNPPLEKRGFDTKNLGRRGGFSAQKLGMEGLVPYIWKGEL